MAITFLEKRKRLKSLMPVLVLIVLLTAVVVWRGFFVEAPLAVPERPLKPIQEVSINFQVLENPALEELQLFEKTSPFEGEIGRENPFISYQEKEESL